MHVGLPQKEPFCRIKTHTEPFFLDTIATYCSTAADCSWHCCRKLNFANLQGFLPEAVTRLSALQELYVPGAAK